MEGKGKKILLLSYYVTWSYWGFINEAKLRSEMQQWPLITFHEYLNIFLFSIKNFGRQEKTTHERWMYMASYALFSNVTTVSTSQHFIWIQVHTHILVEYYKYTLWATCEVKWPGTVISVIHLYRELLFLWNVNACFLKILLHLLIILAKKKCVTWLK